MIPCKFTDFVVSFTVRKATFLRTTDFIRNYLIDWKALSVGKDP